MMQNVISNVYKKVKSKVISNNSRKYSLNLGGAWRTKERTLKDLVAGLKRYKIIKSPEVENAMLKVDRAKYCLASSFAYHDSPQTIGNGQTISAPHMHAAALELLRDYVIRTNAKVLDVGSGSGYLTACLATMVGPGGKVVGLERIQELFDFGKKNIENANKELLDSKKLILVKGDGWKGYKDEAPYDAIHVGAAASELPQVLLNQLKNGGRMVIPVGHKDFQMLLQVDKNDDGTIETKKLTEVLYVPLVKDEL